MQNWMALVEGVLRDLGGETVCVPGAKLHTEVARRDSEQDERFSEYLLKQRLTFRQFLEQNNCLTIHRRLGSDMLIGFVGASLPAEQGIWRLREDVYSAFTRLGERPYVYVPSADVFTTDPPEKETTVEVPSVTLEILVNRRQQFAQSLEDEADRDAVLGSMKWSANPLGAFYRTLVDRDLTRTWHDYNYNMIKQEVLDWANKKELTASDLWFAPSRRGAESVDNPQRVLSELARYMTDDEIRSLSIPFRAVEELFRASTRKHGAGT